jgi:hypothetical protein
MSQRFQFVNADSKLGFAPVPRSLINSHSVRRTHATKRQRRTKEYQTNLGTDLELKRRHNDLIHEPKLSVDNSTWLQASTLAISLSRRDQYLLHHCETKA